MYRDSSQTFPLDEIYRHGICLIVRFFSVVGFKLILKVRCLDAIQLQCPAYLAVFLAGGVS